MVKEYANGPYAEPSRQYLAQIETLARQRLSPVEKLIEEEKFQEAISLLRDVRRTFAGSKTATAAEKRLAELKQSPALAEAIRKAEAEDLLADAKLSLENSDLVRAVARYKTLAEQYTDTPEGNEAKEQLACFDADEDFQKELREAQAELKCRSHFSLARSFRLNKLFEPARAKYEKVIQEFPDTDFAKQAADELKVMAEEMKKAGY